MRASASEDRRAALLPALMSSTIRTSVPGGRTVLVDGRVVGMWKSKRQKNHLGVIVEPFDELISKLYEALEAEVTDLARFLGMPTTLHMLTSP